MTSSPVLWNDRRKRLSLKRKLRIESEETSIVNLRVIPALTMRKGKKERYKMYEIQRVRQKSTICIHQKGSKSLQNPSTLPIIPVA